MCHDLVERLVKEPDFDVSTEVGKVYHVGDFRVEVTPDMAEYIIRAEEVLTQVFGDFRRHYRAGRLLVEQRLDLSSLLGPDQFGTADVVFRHGSVLVVLDYKFGRIEVDPVENTQLQIYALGALAAQPDPENISTVVMYIFQPKVTNDLKRWEISKDDLVSRRQRFVEAAAAAMADDPPRIPGETQCFYCRAKAGCYEHHKWVFENLSFQNLDEDAIKDTPVETLLQIWGRKRAVNQYLNAVEEHLTQLARDGKLPGYTVAPGRPGNRRYEDPERAEAVLREHLGDRAYKTQLISPFQAAKLVGADLIEQLTFRPDGRLKLTKLEEDE